MRRLSILLAVWAGLWAMSTFKSQGQNLVPNHDFDTYTTCPYNKGQIRFAPPWRRANGTTTDFSHACGEGGFAGMPTNQWGSQQAAAGQGYAGIRTWLPFDLYNEPYREYLTVTLLDTLKAGKRYFVSFKVSPGESAKYVTDDIGLAFGDSLIRGGAILDYDPVIEQTTGIMIDNFVGWTEISGEYVAEGWETDLVIGNFKSDSATTLRARDNSEDLEASTYLYVDEVVIEACEDRYQGPLILAQDSALCPGKETQLTANPALDLGDFRWSNGQETSIITAEGPGLYTLEAQLAGCTLRDSLVVQARPGPQFELGTDTVLCPGERLRLSVEPSEDVFRWNTGDTTNAILVQAAGTYALQASRAGCSWTDSISVAYESIPPSNFQRDTLICEGAELVLDPGVAAGTFLWSNNATTPTLTVSETGIYTVQVETNCFVFQEQYGVTVENCACVLAVSNVFSPNDDGINDRFAPRLPSGAELIQTTIVDRWGTTVFRSNSLDRGWDGMKNGSPLPEGVYYWEVYYRCFDRNAFQTLARRGHLTLLR